jgi:predicted HicB family RNase H-like nuclease
MAPISKLNLRLPRELRLKLEAAKLTNRRSLNQEICKRLEDSFRETYRI